MFDTSYQKSLPLKVGIKKPIGDHLGSTLSELQEQEKENISAGENRCKTSFRKTFDKMHSKPIIMVRGSEFMRQERLRIEAQSKSRAESPAAEV